MSIPKGRFRLAFVVHDKMITPLYHNNLIYVPLQPGDQYQLKLFNNHYTRADAEVAIDGHKVGIWHVPPHSNVTIGRTFAFFQEETKGLESIVGKQVEVHFRPAGSFEVPALRRHEALEDDLATARKGTIKSVDQSKEQVLSVLLVPEPPVNSKGVEKNGIPNASIHPQKSNSIMRYAWDCPNVAFSPALESAVVYV